MHKLGNGTLDPSGDPPQCPPTAYLLMRYSELEGRGGIAQRVCDSSYTDVYTSNAKTLSGQLPRPRDPR